MDGLSVPSHRRLRLTDENFDAGRTVDLGRIL